MESAPRRDTSLVLICCGWPFVCLFHPTLATSSSYYKQTGRGRHCGVKKKEKGKRKHCSKQKRSLLLNQIESKGSSERTDLNANECSSRCASVSLTVLNNVCQARYIISTDRHTDKQFRCCQTKAVNLVKSTFFLRVMIIDTAGFQGPERSRGSLTFTFQLR